MLNHDAIELGTLLSREANPTVPADRIDGILARAHATRISSFRDSVTLVIRYDPVVVEEGELRIYPNIYERHAVHSEAVYQALLAAGYDVSGVDLASVRAVLKQAKGRKAVLRLPLETALGAPVPKRSPDTAAGRRLSSRPPTSH